MGPDRPVNGRDYYEARRRQGDPPWEALPAVARRGWIAAADEASKNVLDLASRPTTSQTWHPPAAPTVPASARPPRHAGPFRT